ncbi:uncharacterized, partial [Tachysurus ichikawai]
MQSGHYGNMEEYDCVSRRGSDSTLSFAGHLGITAENQLFKEHSAPTSCWNTLRSALHNGGLQMYGITRKAGVPLRSPLSVRTSTTPYNLHNPHDLHRTSTTPIRPPQLHTTSTAHDPTQTHNPRKLSHNFYNPSGPPHNPPTISTTPSDPLKPHNPHNLHNPKQHPQPHMT